MSTPNTSPHLDLPFLFPGQAQKHLTVNDGLSRLDSLIHLSVEDLRTDPPEAPQEGTRYLVDISSTHEVWKDKAGHIAVYQNGHWCFLSPKPGWRCWNAQEEQMLVFQDGWQVFGENAVNETDKLGIHTVADDYNRLSVRADASLFTHENGSHRQSLNKGSEADIVSQHFQSDYVSHAELGLIGDNDVRLKVSPDGQNWHEAMKVDKDNGTVFIDKLRSGTLFVDSEATTRLIPPQTAGFCLLVSTSSAYPQIHHSVIFAYDIGLSPNIAALCKGRDMVCATGLTLTEGNGTAGKTNITIEIGAIVIKNRYQNGLTYSFTFLG